MNNPKAKMKENDSISPHLRLPPHLRGVEPVTNKPSPIVATTIPLSTKNDIPPHRRGLETSSSSLIDLATTSERPKEKFEQKVESTKVSNSVQTSYGAAEPSKAESSAHSENHTSSARLVDSIAARYERLFPDMKFQSLTESVEAAERLAATRQQLRGTGAIEPGKVFEGALAELKQFINEMRADLKAEEVAREYEKAQNSTEAISVGMLKRATALSRAEDLPAKFSEPYPCTYHECLRGYDTLKALKLHKKEHHDYCQACDLDFEDDTALLRHKIQSDRHIVCPMCAQSFRSSQGRDAHIRQTHAAEQNIKCQGCGENFIRAGSLMDHIEKGQCVRISRAEFEKQRALKAFRVAQLAALRKAEVDDPYLTEPIAEEDDAGGVLLKLGDPVETNDEEVYLQAFPELPKPDTAEKHEELSKMMSEARITKAFGDRSGIENQSINGSTPVWSNNIVGGTSATLFPNAKVPTFAEAILAEKESLVRLHDSDGQVIDPSSKNFNPYKFQNAVGTFKCPYPTCGKSFPSVPKFRQHMLSPVHQGVEHRCPWCLKIFKSPTALTQHMEAPTTRCKVKETTNFASAVNLVSGGYLTVAGQHTDGTVMFSSGETEETEEMEETEW